MLLCLDVGNTHIFGGVFNENNLAVRFRYATNQFGTADQFGLFLINILHVNNIKAEDISAVAVCSVVPGYDYTIRHAVTQYFNKSKFFMLQAGVKTGLNIKYKNPPEVGADLIAAAIGAVNAFPDKNIIIIDMGTATTVSAVTTQRDFLGGAILPGMRLSMEALRSNTAKLMEVTIQEPDCFIGRTTRECIQSGIYYGHLGALKELVSRFKQEAFKNETVMVIGTGGFSQLYKDKSLYDVILPDLVLQGLQIAYELARAPY